MRYLRAALLACILSITAMGCSKKPATSQEPTTNTAPTATSEGPAAVSSPSAPNAAVAEALPAPGAAAANAVPPAGVSEMDDDNSETVDNTSGNTSKSLIVQPDAASAPVSQFKEGTHYQKLVVAQPTDAAPGHIEVAEVFWYGCGHCYALDPLIESWRAKQKPAYVDFVRIPAIWNETLRIHARMFYTAQALGKLDELHIALFRELHLHGNPLDTEEKIGAFFRSHGVSDADFRQAFSSFAVQTRLNQADIANRRYKIQSVPTLIINGKFTTDVGLAGSAEKLIQLVDELAAREHGR